MANLIPRDTFFHDMADFRRNFDQAFNRLLRWPSAQEERTYASEFSPAVESFIDKDNKKFHCQVVLPGVDPKDVDIQVQGDTLTITGERTNSRETREADFLQREITYGSFTRSLVLPEGVDRDLAFHGRRPGQPRGSHDFAASAMTELKRDGVVDLYLTGETADTERDGK